jgi:hypothetical protein
MEEKKRVSSRTGQKNTQAILTGKEGKELSFNERVSE